MVLLMQQPAAGMPYLPRSPFNIRTCVDSDLRYFNPCRNAVEKKTVLENLDLVLLVMDETVDGGYVHVLDHMCYRLVVELPSHRSKRLGCAWPVWLKQQSPVQQARMQSVVPSQIGTLQASKHA